LGLSRRIGESFAMLTPHPSLSEYDIGVNPLGDGKYQARMDQFGPAVLPSLVPYRAAQATVDARELPIGLNVGRGTFDFAPTYKRGTVVTVGTGATVFLLATVKDATGEPVGLQGGTIRSASDPDEQPLLLFTNRVGRLAVDGLRPGRYVIEFMAAPGQHIDLTIPDSANGQYDAGELVLPVRPVVAQK
jgi:outer membrane usher protein